MLNRNIGVFSAVTLVAFVSGGWLLQRETEEQEARYHRARLLNDIVASVSAYYVDSLSAAELYDLAIDGLLNKLGDPYTDFLRDEDFGDMTLTATGNYSGLGLRVEANDGWVTVVAPMSGGPAETAGVRAGDQIVEIEGESTYGWSVDRAVSVLRGETGSPVNFSVGRPGVREPIAFLVERAPIHVNSIRFADLLSDGVGYIWLESVTEESSAELTEQINDLRERGAKSIVLDLRWNPGGVLGQAIALSDMFLDPGDVVVETRGRDRRANRVFSADRTENWSEMPLLVLVNGFSASASEIIAGALQDHDRALLVGTPTFGKGLVQSVFPFGRVQALKLTTGRWYTPVGRSIHRTPIDPDQNLDSVLALADPEEYHTEGGRPLKGGGGGIHPDILVEPRELTEDEIAFNDALGSHVQAFRDVLGAYAREMTAGEQVTEDFVTTRGMRAELLRRLQDRGASMPNRVWSANAELVSKQFAYQVLRFGLGIDAEMRRRMSDDRVVERALEILSGVGTREELMRAVPQN